MKKLSGKIKQIFKQPNKKSLQTIKKEIGASFKSTSFRQGSYRGALTVLVIVILIVANLVVRQLPTKWQSIDLTEEQILEVSNVSKKFLKSMDDSIQMVVVADKSSTDTRIKSFIENYADLSDNISVKWIDPVVHPSALTNYNVEENTIYIKDKTTDKSTTVAFSNILSSSYDSSYNTVTTFDGEGQLTSALNTLTNTTKQKVYLTEGHGEGSLPSTISTLFTKANYETDMYNSVLTDTMSTDANLLLIYGPTTDFTDNEIKNLESYIADGGKVMVALSSENPDLPKLLAFLKAYGLAETSGYIADTERSFQGSSYYLYPELSLSGDYATGITNKMLLIANTKGFTSVDPSIDNVTVTNLMTTSSNGYNVTDEEQKQGTYILAAVVDQKTVATDTTDSTSESTTSSTAEKTEAGKLTVLSTTNMVDDTLLSNYPTLENSTLFMNMVSGNFDGTTNLSIEAKTLGSNQNTVVSAGQYSISTIFILPGAILIGGFILWFRRRKV
ncbi:Gldg family protein [Enterococcus camelliae]|uniref:Gldg family protein n=1 Tax=Enterococcus camelliae TaxID=453959 RepID=A0ABW5TIA8_9ENTE